MAPVREISRKPSQARSDRALQRRAGELRLAHYAHTRDTAERDELVRRYMPLARSAAARYQHTSESFDDLLQVAAIGLLKAIDRYDPGRGNAFSSFAVPTILGELRRHLRDHSWSIRVPRELQELGQRLRAATDELVATVGRPPTVAELAAHLNVTEEAVLDARQATAAHSPASLDEPVSHGQEAASLGERLGADDNRLANAETTVVLDSYLARLPERNREILRLRFHDDLKQREIGARLGVSQMHVSRLIRQSLEQLRSFVPNADDGGSARQYG